MGLLFLERFSFLDKLRPGPLFPSKRGRRRSENELRLVLPHVMVKLFYLAGSADPTERPIKLACSRGGQRQSALKPDPTNHQQTTGCSSCWTAHDSSCLSVSKSPCPFGRPLSKCGASRTCSRLGRLLTEYLQGVDDENIRMKSGKMKSLLLLDRHTWSPPNSHSSAPFRH